MESSIAEFLLRLLASALEPTKIGIAHDPMAPWHHGTMAPWPHIRERDSYGYPVRVEESSLRSCVFGGPKAYEILQILRWM